MFHMASRRALVVAGLAAILTAPLAWSQDAPPVRVRGTIERTEGPVFVVKSRDGTELKIVLADNAVAVGVVKAALADIKPGSFVGIAAMPQSDEKGAEAAAVRAFNLKEGQRKRLLVREAGLDADE